MAVPTGIHHGDGRLMTTATLTARLGTPGYPASMSFSECAQWLDVRNWSEFLTIATNFPTATGHVTQSDAISYFSNSGWI